MAYTVIWYGRKGMVDKVTFDAEKTAKDHAISISQTRGAAMRSGVIGGSVDRVPMTEGRHHSSRGDLYAWSVPVLRFTAHGISNRDSSSASSRAGITLLSETEAEGGAFRL